MLFYLSTYANFFYFATHCATASITALTAMIFSPPSCRHCLCLYGPLQVQRWHFFSLTQLCFSPGVHCRCLSFPRRDCQYEWGYLRTPRSLFHYQLPLFSNFSFPSTATINTASTRTTLRIQWSVSIIFLIFIYVLQTNQGSMWYMTYNSSFLFFAVVRHHRFYWYRASFFFSRTKQYTWETQKNREQKRLNGGIPQFR